MFLSPVNNRYLSDSKRQDERDIRSTSSILNSAQAATNINNNVFPPPYVKQGFDWSLPANTKTEPYSGLTDNYTENAAYINNAFLLLRWDEINPAKGKFDFSLLDAELKRVNKRPLLIRLEVNSACEAPKWVLKSLRSTQKKSLVFWDKQYTEFLSPLIKAFAKRYAGNPQIAGVQLGIGDGEYNGSCQKFSNKNGWGEFWMTPEELKEAEEQFGLTPELFIKSTKEIIDLYTKAFVGNVGKLAFTNLDPYFSWTERSERYNKLMPQIADYVLNKGIGNRDGEVKVWMRYLYDSYGISFHKHEDDSCNLKMDEAFANKIKGRYWGTENEFYGKETYILNYGGPYKNQAYRFFVSSLRALQMRRNFITIYDRSMQNIDDPFYRTQEFLRYLRRTLGKQIENTPDAFVLFGERYINASRVNGYTQSGESCVKNNKISIRSFGRWLTEKSQSQPAVRIHMPKNENYWAQGSYLPEAIDYEYAARSGKRFRFDVNDNLAKIRCKNNCQAEIKVTFKDVVKTSFNVDVAEGSTKAIHTQGDGKIKTVTFPLKSKFKNGLQGFDFNIESKKEPISIMMVRMNIL